MSAWPIVKVCIDYVNYVYYFVLADVCLTHSKSLYDYVNYVYYFVLADVCLTHSKSVYRLYELCILLCLSRCLPDP